MPAKSCPQPALVPAWFPDRLGGRFFAKASAAVSAVAGQTDLPVLQGLPKCRDAFHQSNRPGCPGIGFNRRRCGPDGPGGFAGCGGCGCGGTGAASA
jgi:hypothetical protein